MTDARIIDRGYRRFGGERTGVSGAVRSVAVATMQRALGIHRKARYKVLPVLIILITYVPAMVFVGITVITNQLPTQEENFEDNFGSGSEPQIIVDEDDNVTVIDGESLFEDAASSSDAATEAFTNQLIEDFPGQYGNIVLAIALFAAFVAPEVLCTDRRTGMLGLYLASPLTRPTYLASKAIAVGAVLLTVTLGPSLVLLVGYSTQGYGPSGVGDWLSTVGRIFAAGIGIAAFHTVISLAISSITSRRAVASSSFVVLLLGSGVLVAVLTEDGQMSERWGMLNVLTLPSEFAYRVFGQVSEVTPSTVPVMPAWSVYVAFFGWILAGLLVIADRYRRMEVTK